MLLNLLVIIFILLCCKLANLMKKNVFPITYPTCGTWIKLLEGDCKMSHILLKNTLFIKFQVTSGLPIKATPLLRSVYPDLTYPPGILYLFFLMFGICWHIPCFQ